MHLRPRFPSSLRVWTVSAKGDTDAMIDFAEKCGLTVEKAKHGGYVAHDQNGTVIARIHTGGNQPRNWIKATRRRIKRWMDAQA